MMEGVARGVRSNKFEPFTLRGRPDTNWKRFLVCQSGYKLRRPFSREMLNRADKFSWRVVTTLTTPKT